MNARDVGGEAHAPAPHDLVRAPLTSADTYDVAPAADAVTEWDYEAAVDVPDASPVAVVWRTRAPHDASWSRAVGRRHGGAQRAVVVRGARGAA